MSNKLIYIKASLIALLLVVPSAWTPMFLTWVANIVCEYFIGRYLDTKLGKKDRDVISLAYKKASKRFSKEFKSKLISDKSSIKHNLEDIINAIKKGELDLDSSDDMNTFNDLFKKEMNKFERGRNIVNSYLIPAIDKRTKTIEEKIDMLQDKLSSQVNSILLEFIKKYEDNVFRLKIKSALDVLKKLEDVLNENPEAKKCYGLFTLIKLEKGKCELYFVPKDAYQDLKYVRKSMSTDKTYEYFLQAAFYSKNIDDEVIAYAQQTIDEERSLPIAYFIICCYTGNIEENIKKIPKDILSNINFKSYIYQWFVDHYDKSEVIKKYVPFKYDNIPDDLNFNNLEEWKFIVSLLMTEKLQCEDFDNDGYPFIPEIINNHIAILEKFEQLVQKTEISNRLNQVNVYYKYLMFITTRDNKWFNEIIKIKLQDDFTNRLKANAYYISGDAEQAYNLISQDKDECSMRHKVWFAIKWNNENRIKDAIKQFASVIGFKQDQDIYIVFNALRKYSFLAKDNDVSDVIIEAYYKEGYKAIILSELIKLLKGNIIDIEKLKKMCDNISGLSLAITCHLLSLANETEFALDTLSKHINKDKPSPTLTIYLYILAETKTHKDEFRKICKNLRDKYNFVNFAFLDLEGLYALEIQEYNEAIEVYEIFKKAFPLGEYMMARYVHALAFGNRRDDIEAQIKDIISINYTNNVVLIYVANSLLKQRFYQEALDLVYRYAIDRKNVAVRSFYFQMRLDYVEENNLIFIEPLKVEEGFIVRCKYGKEAVEFIAAMDSKYENAIGKSKGETFIDSEKTLLTISLIGNKYCALYQEISDESLKNNNPYKDFKVMDVKDLGGTAILDMIEKETEQYNVDAKIGFTTLVGDYKRRKLPLLILMNNDVVMSAHDLLFSKFRIYVDPIEKYKQLLDEYYQEHKVTHFVLDIMSMWLFAYLSKKHGIKFSNKFVISKRQAECIKYSLEELQVTASSVNHLYFYSIFSQDYVDTIGSTYQESLRYLNDWVNVNCEILPVEEKLLVAQDVNGDIKTEIFADCVLLACRDGYILISDDWNLSFQTCSNLKIITSETFLKVIENNGDNINDIYHKLQYVGIKFNATQMYSEYQKYRVGNENIFECCLETIQNNPMIWQDVIDLCHLITINKFQLPSDMQSVTTIFTRMLTNMDLDTTMEIRAFIVNKYKIEVLARRYMLESFDNARLIIQS
ncbi:hypothetical protein [Segatella paludivivens]|uniref:hypothetical protein n=1 Tax=Segatella paludivivens TaxID=185294 RepID=UPI000372FFC1|nr:hypothetical protein [Segatella paludivivens]